MEAKKRLSHIDLLECFAILFVVIYHSRVYSFDFVQENSFLNYLLYFARTILSTCVPLFFFANGYLLFNRKFDLNKHIKKILRLIALVFVWAFLLMPIYMIIEKEPLNVKTIISSILSLDTSWTINYLWFIGAIVCIYVLFPALKALFDSNKKSFVFFVVACAILTFGVVFANHGILLLESLTQKTIPGFSQPIFRMFNPFRGSYGYSFVYFCVGGLIYKYEPKILSIPKAKRNIISVLGIIISSAMLFLLGVFMSHYEGGVWDVVWGGYDTVFTFLNVIFIYVLCLNYTKDYSLIKNISCNTLGMYFIHGIILRLTRPLVKSVDFLCNFPFSIIYSAAVICLCLLLCLLIKKVKILRNLVS